MLRKRLSRQEKEKLCIEKIYELQTMWGNPVGPSDPEYQLNPSGYWDFVRKWSDEELDEHIKETIGQIKFEKGYDWIKTLVKVIVGAFVALGVIGLLVFGIKQLIALF